MNYLTFHVISCPSNLVIIPESLQDVLTLAMTCFQSDRTTNLKLDDEIKR
ncbi:hypothetical protein [Nostoc sp. C052]|nr:hypothetical protein [Nostoc sp. C052]